MYSKRNLNRLFIKSLLAVGCIVAAISEVNKSDGSIFGENLEVVEEGDSKDSSIVGGALKLQADYIGGTSMLVNIPYAGSTDIMRTSFLYCKAEEDIGEPIQPKHTDNNLSTDDELTVQNAPENVPNYASGCRSYNYTYMGYKTVTSRGTEQYKLLNSADSWTDANTGLRMYKDRVCIAVGSAYTTNIGDKIDLVLENGNVVHCVLGDVKSDRHTDSSHTYQAQDGSVVETIIDYAYFNNSKSYADVFSGRIKKVVVLDNIFRESI